MQSEVIVGAVSATVGSVVAYLTARRTAAHQERSIEAEVEQRLWTRTLEEIKRMDAEMATLRNQVKVAQAVMDEQSAEIRRLTAEVRWRDARISTLESEVLRLQRNTVKKDEL